MWSFGGFMKNIFLLLSIVGAIIPYVFFGQFISLNGLDLILFSKSLFVNGAVGGFSADLLITSVVFWIFVKQTKWRPLFPFLLINLFIGLSCALPLYLYFGAKDKRIG